MSLTGLDRNSVVSPTTSVTDVHSFGEPHKFSIQHLDLDLRVLFDSRVLEGVAEFTIKRRTADQDAPLVLDTRGLEIQQIEAAGTDGAYRPVKYDLGAADPILGSPLGIQLPAVVSRVRIAYRTGTNATALQWLEPHQTAGKRHPFLYTQSQEIHARTWIPIQDTPAVRLTYSARVQTPKGLVAVMSAENNPDATRDGSNRFRMNRPIPPYLIALAAGDLRFASTSERTGVYAEEGLIEQAKYEFGEADKMIRAAEELYGPYLWGRFDILVLPPSFPFAGMENPGLIFVTPTLIVGDRSCVSVIAHELAHAWSGNLVTNATWSDFWLNEGFTTYIEYRIQERLYGKSRADMERVLSQQRLAEEMAKLEPRDQVLHIDLERRDPDCGSTLIPYVKGALFLESFERCFGRSRFDQFLKSYFAHFKFQSITTEEAVSYLRTNLLDQHPDVAFRESLEEWINEPGLPRSAPVASSSMLNKIRAEAKAWYEQNASLRTTNWSTHEWLYFLRSLPSDLRAERMQELDNCYDFTHSRNVEILHQWLLMAIRNGYERGSARLEEFLATVGRRIFIKPLYEELVRTRVGKERAEAIYWRVRSNYHPISQATIDRIVGPPSSPVAS